MDAGINPLSSKSVDTVSSPTTTGSGTRVVIIERKEEQQDPNMDEVMEEDIRGRIVPKEESGKRTNELTILANAIYQQPWLIYSGRLTKYY